MDDARLATVIRQVRQARGWRQADLAAKSGVSQATISRLERGRVGQQPVACIRAIAATLDIRVDLVPRWHGGDLDRLLNRRHSALHESVARTFRDRWPAWELIPEASFSVYGERGIIDLLAWHPGRRALLVVELKTELVDLNELLGTFDRKRRLARGIAVDRGWDAAAVSAWLIVRHSKTNRRRLGAHGSMVGAALPDGRRTVEAWLRDPVGKVAGVAFWTDIHPVTGRAGRGPIRRVSTSIPNVSERGSSRRRPDSGP